MSLTFATVVAAAFLAKPWALKLGHRGQGSLLPRPPPPNNNAKSKR